jgi:hypothetical protein
LLFGFPIESGGSGGRVELNAGESLALSCAAALDPLLAPTASYHWAREGLEVGSSQLVIPYLLREHAGTYTCHVRTILGTGTHNQPYRLINSNLMSQAMCWRFFSFSKNVWLPGMGIKFVNLVGSTKMFKIWCFFRVIDPN